MKRYFWLLCLAISCTDGKKEEPAKQSENSGLSFVFSDQEATSGSDSGNTWCTVSLPAAVPINADPENSNRRIFTINDSPHRVTVGFGNIVAAFVLQKTGNKVAIFTSDNFPECLSNRTNFVIGASGTTFHYDNLKHITFDVELLPLPNGAQVTLILDSEAGFGIVVRR